MDNIIEILKNKVIIDDSMLKFINTYSSVLNYYINKGIDISDFFDSNGAKDKFFETIIGDENDEICKSVFSIDEWKKYYKPAKEVYFYLNMLKKIGFDHRINNDGVIDGVNEILKEVTDELYNLDSENFIIFNIDGWRDLVELSTEQERYIEFIRKYGFILSNDINSEEDILDKFSDDTLINLMNEKTKTSDIMQQYVLFNETYGPILNYWISDIAEIDDYFNQNGPNSKLMDILLTDLFDYVFSNNLTLKNIYIEDERLKKYINFRNKYNKLFSDQNDLVFIGIKYKNIDSILNDFDENGITNNFINKLIKYYDKKIFDYIFQDDEWRNFISDTNYKKIEQFFVLIEKYDIYLNDINEIDDYLRDFKPGDKLYESSLYNSNIFNSLDIDEIKKHFENNPKIVTYVDFISKYGYISFIKNLEDIEKYFTVDNLRNDLKDKLFKEESDRFLKINWEEYGDLKTAQYIKSINEDIFAFRHYIRTYYDIEIYFDDKGPKKFLYYTMLKNSGINLDEINYMTLENFDIIPEMDQFLSFLYKNNCFSIKFINSINSIKTHFDEKGMKESSKLLFEIIKNQDVNIMNFLEENNHSTDLYELILFMPDEIFKKIFVYNEIWKNYYMPEPEIEQYIIFRQKIPNLLLLSNKKEIFKYFSDKGPNQEFFESRLFDKNNFIKIFGNNVWKDYYEPDLVINSYINFCKKNNKIFKDYINEVSDIYNYFDDGGPKYIFIDKLFETEKWEEIKRESRLSSVQFTIINSYFELNSNFKFEFKNIIMNLYPDIKEEDVGCIADICKKIQYSNSTEIQHLGAVIISQIYQTTDTTDDLINKFNKVEEIFLDNKIPYVVKAFKVFEMLNPNFGNFDFKESSTISPNLKRYSNNHKKLIIFSDLLKCTLSSNNRSIKEYLKDIKLGNEIYVSIINSNTDINMLDEEQYYILSEYTEYLRMIYKLTKKDEESLDNVFTGNLITDIKILSDFFKPMNLSGDLNKINPNELLDRIIKMFGYFIGFDTFNSLENYINNIVLDVDRRNREKVNNNNLETLEYGDLVKGLGGINYLGNILQNGSIAREFLGDSAGSDATPLDTDLSMVINDLQESIGAKINGTAAHGYGPIYLVLKNNDRFNVTRTPNENSEYSKLDLSKYELFYTGVLGEGHYGIRTGFPSSEIDYIVVEYYDFRVGLEIVMNGFYIPVLDMNGNLVFSPKDYDFLRSKMNGLSYYEKDTYNFATDLDSPGYMLNYDNNLVVPSVDEIVGQLQSNNDDISVKREYINELIRRIIVEGPEKINEFKTRISRNILSGSVEFLDTGSTGRGTNVPNDADFDFVMRIDRDILLDNERRYNFVSHIANELGFDSNCIQNGNIRKGKIKLPNSDVELEIDITFVSKTNKLEYSTEMCVEDRMTNIKKQSPESYPYVLANIIYAKKFLKAHNVYKPDRSDSTQGGMGGVGVENWILQNGGSFKEAARSFMEVANTCSSYEEFKCKYHVFDFGSNHMAESRDSYPHDDFVWNMNQIGYDKMKQALSNYLTYIDTISLEEESIHKK